MSALTADPMNEVTFVARLGAFTRVRAERLRGEGKNPLIAFGDVEERQVDPMTGRYLRCDMRLNDGANRKLVSGEMKRPEHPDGRDPRNEVLRADARNKAIARGLPYYFTCNMAELVLYAVPARPGDVDREEASYQLAPIHQSGAALAWMADIETAWNQFLGDLERRLETVYAARPSVTTADVLALRAAIYAIADEAIVRVEKYVSSDPMAIERARHTAQATFGLPVALDPRYKSNFRRDLLQVLRLAAFVVAQKLILHRVLSEVGPRRGAPFRLDEVSIAETSTDPTLVAATIEAAVAQAITRSLDYETAFLPTPHADLLFLPPRNPDEVRQCRSGEVWSRLLKAVQSASWAAISQSLVGFLYEVIVEPEFRHELGQYYTREDVVDILTTFAVRDAADTVLDPASGGGSFARSLYRRKRDLGSTHEQALAEVWTVEISAFAAGLTTIELATADTTEPGAYPRVVLQDFFEIEPGMVTSLDFPGGQGPLRFPSGVDGVVGNPPYISYRRQTNHSSVIKALSKESRGLPLPGFSGKSDAYAWFIVHSAQFLKPGGRLAFVVSSAMLFADYGIPLIRFLGRYFRIRAVVDSMVERWFVEADTNTVLLLVEREDVFEARSENEMRFVRLRRPLARLLAAPHDLQRREDVETLVHDILVAPTGGDDPRFSINCVAQGEFGGLAFIQTDDGGETDLIDDEDQDEV